ncbi:MAG: hypothetical protein ACI9BW_004430, partial [Gammaproteobacteria bacterium]
MLTRLSISAEILFPATASSTANHSAADSIENNE